MHRSLPLTAVLILCLGATASCGTAPMPYVLEISIFPTAEGIDVLMEVDGGPGDLAWVGFGAGPGAPEGILARIHSVTARGDDGTELPMIPVGMAGYEVDVEDTPRPWKLAYSLDLSAAVEPDTFYRASIRGEDSLLLVGSDAWARFFDGPEPLQLDPRNRPAGRIGRARVDFNIPESWQVITTAGRKSSRSVELLEHPVGTVFALGPYHLERHGTLRVARHEDWDILPNEAGEMLADLMAALERRLGKPTAGFSPGHPTVELGPGTEPIASRPLVLLSPFPDGVEPDGGLRTTGMVRGDTLLVYAGFGPDADPRDVRIPTAMAVFMGHELFHLYVPSAVAVSHDVSWLSEGWAMHMGRLAAVDAGLLEKEELVEQVEETYRRYLDIGGYRAGSLPAASMGSEGQRDLLYLRGELVFRLLSQEWIRDGRPGGFEEALWRELLSAARRGTPVDAAEVKAILEDMFDPVIVRRYVEGTAPLTPPVLGIPLY